MRTPEGPCEHCGKHKATHVWFGEGGPLAASRDYMQAVWCECCMLDAQIAYTMERIAALSGLVAARAATQCKEVARD